jgi:putative hydrolase of the HAD superfamily
VVSAVTFDFWNTLMWEEPGSLREKRLEAWRELLGPVDSETLERAHDGAHQEYVDSWVAGRQFRVEEAVEHILDGTNGALGKDAAAALGEGFSEGGRRAAIHPSDGVHDCLEALRKATVKIGIVCDIGLTPSPIVRELLDRDGLLAYFDGMSFSDEVGHYKPHPAIFEHALAGLGGIPAGRAAHVGDRVRTDVDGAASMGMTAVRYTGVYEDELAGTRDFELVVSHLAELPQLLEVS